MSSLPRDIVTEILCRLPVKSLLRFRCVSKQWCSHIDCPDFIKLHLNHSLKTNTNLSLILSLKDIFALDLDTLDKAVKLINPIEIENGSCRTEVVGSCNGLLALYNWIEDVALWNPYTKRYRKIPIMKIESPRSRCMRYFGYGFGYDPVTDDYKLVRLVQFYGHDREPTHSEVKVYSLKSNSWRRIGDLPYYFRYNGDNGVLANNALHWVVNGNPESDTRHLIVAFDLRTEEYFEVQQPDYVIQYYYLEVGVLGGCLYVLCNHANVCIDIWVMKEYRVKESWTKLLSVAQAEIGDYLFGRPLIYSKSGDKVMLKNIGEKLVWYDLREKKRAEKVIIQDAPKLFKTELCVASLVPLTGKNGTNAKRRWWMDWRNWQNRLFGDGKRIG